jgi:two-component system heavy metal sensor histidine kinase CusS
MTIWYALCGFGLVLVTTGLLYWVLVNSLYEENFRDLADNLNNARMLLDSSSMSSLGQAASARPSWAPAQQPEIYLRVLDQHARVLVETSAMTSKLPPPTEADLRTISAAGGERREITSQSGKPFLTLIVPIEERGANTVGRFMQVAMDRQHDQDLLSEYRQRLWMALVVALVLSSLIGYLIAHAGMRPIARIVHAAERIRHTTLHERIDPVGLPAELSGLAATFNNMLDRLQETFQRVSQFSDDVAHELRTPINNLRGEIEVALSRARSGDDYRETLGSCLEECDRISRLIQSLLFLARMENSTEFLPSTTIDIRKELATVQEFYGAAAAEAGVSLQMSTPEGLTVQMDRTLFQQAIGNLVSNAIAHTKAGGMVGITTKANDGKLYIVVTDTGCGIAANHLPHIFDRFYRADPARTNSGQNVGLGLAVVKRIVDRHGGQVAIKSELGRGTTVTLTL